MSKGGVRHGQTGVLVDGVPGAVAAAGLVEGLRRRDCRDDVEARCTAHRMVAGYADLFARVVFARPSEASRSSSSGTSTNAKRTDESLTP